MAWSLARQMVGKPVEELDTPSLLLDLDKVERNLDAMARLVAGKLVRLRPHIKTHKVPNLALMQLERGAIGVSCAKVGEAEVMAAGGVSNLLVTAEVVGDTKIRRLLGIAQQVKVITVVDDARAAQQLSEAAAAAGLKLQCLVDVNVGQNRTGVEPGEPALQLARQVLKMKGLELVGLQGYEGHLQHIVDARERAAANAKAMKLLSDTAVLLRDKGLPIEIVSTAGTGTSAFAARWEEVTELQPGSYVVMDAGYSGVEGLDFENALTVLVSVISKRGNVAIVDAGVKSLTTDYGLPVPKDLDATYKPAGVEHGTLTFEHGNLLSIGDKLEILPRHADGTINVYDHYHVTRGGRVVAVWPIAARGQSQ